MENLLELKTEHHNSWNTELRIDNGTEFKDFDVLMKPTGDRKGGEKNIKIQLSGLGEGESKCLEIGGITLIGREVDLLIEFLNQKK